MEIEDAEPGYLADLRAALGAASVNSPDLTGTPTAPTANPGTNTNQLATTSFVGNAIATETAARQAVDELKAALNSPSFTGLPTAPTAPTSTNTTQIATTAFVQSLIAALVDNSPGLLNTLNELAAALGDDPNFATTVLGELALKANQTDLETTDSTVSQLFTDVSTIIGELSSKAQISSPAFEGVPTAPTASTSTNTTQLATTAFVQAVVAALVDSSPAALNTLNELAAALGNDPNFATSVINELALKADQSDLDTLSGDVSGKAASDFSNVSSSALGNLGSTPNNTVQFYDDFSQHPEGNWVKNGDMPLVGNPLRFNFATPHQVTAYAVAVASSPGVSAVTAGNANVTVTGVNIVGSPLVIPVALTNGDDDIAVANKIKTALSAVPAVTSKYTVGGTLGDIAISSVSWTGSPNVIVTSVPHGLNPGDTFRIKNFTASGVGAAAAVPVYNNNWFVVNSVTNATTFTIAPTAAHSTCTVTGGTLGKPVVSLTSVSGITAPFDHTLNVAIANGTCTGLLAKSESYHTQGAAPIIVSDLQSISVVPLGTTTSAGNIAMTVTGRYVAGGSVVINFAVANTTPPYNGSNFTGWIYNAVVAFNQHPAVNQTYVASQVNGTMTIQAKSVAYRPFYDPTLAIAFANGTTTGVTTVTANTTVTGGGQKYLMGSNNCLFYMSSYAETMPGPKKLSITCELELSRSASSSLFDRGPNISFMESEMIPVGGNSITSAVNGHMVHTNFSRKGIDSSYFYDQTEGNIGYDQFLGGLNWSDVYSKIGYGRKFLLTIEADDNEVRFSAFGKTITGRHPLMATKVGNPEVHFWFEGGGDGNGADISLWKLHRWWVNSPALDRRQPVDEGGAGARMGAGLLTQGQLHLVGDTVIRTANVSPYALAVGGTSIDVATGHVTGGTSLVEGALRLGLPTGSNGTIVTGVAGIASDDNFTQPLVSPANLLVASGASFFGLGKAVNLPNGMCERLRYVGSFGATPNTKRMAIKEAGGILFDTGPLTENGTMWELEVLRVSHVGATERWVFIFYSPSVGRLMGTATANRGTQFTGFAVHADTAAVTGEINVLWRLGETFPV